MQTDSPLVTGSATLIASTHSVNCADQESYVPERDPDTGTITETENVSALPLGDDQRTFLGDLGDTNTLEAQYQQFLAQELTNPMSLHGSDKGVCTPKPSRSEHPCEHQGCEKSFTTRRGLLHHTELHERPKSQKCEAPNCQRKFRYPKDLRRHQITHEEGIEPQRCHFLGCSKAYNRKDNLQRHIHRRHEGNAVDGSMTSVSDGFMTTVSDGSMKTVSDGSVKTVSKPKLSHTGLADLCQNSVGPSINFGSTRQYSNHLDCHYSQAQVEHTTWKGEFDLHGVVEPFPAKPSDDFGHDDKEWFPYPLWDFDSQNLEAPLQGDRDETCKQPDTAEKLAHCQGGHEPPGHVAASPVHCDALQPPEFRKPGTVIPCPLPCPLDPKKECSGKDENMASLLRKLRSQYHGIYYHNQCKKLLSAPLLHPSDNAELLRKTHEENEQLWSSHTEECHAKFCVLAECAPNPLGDLRHKRVGRCSKTRGNVKQAEFNYLCYTLGISQLNIEVGIKHDHSGQRNAPRNSTASLPIVKTEPDALKAERHDTLSEDDNTRLTKEVERLKGSIETLEKDRAEHISIMRHLVQDMLQKDVELSDVVRERLDRHAPSVLPKHSWESSQSKPTAHHIHNYPYTPSSSSATPMVVKRERDGNLEPRETHYPSGALLAQDFPGGEHPSLLFPAKRQRTDSTGPGDRPLSIVPDSQSATPRCTPMSMNDLPAPFDQHIRKQVVPGPGHGQSSPGHQYTKQSWSELDIPSVPTNYQETPTIAGEDEYIRQRPAPDFVHPGGTNLPPSIASASENLSFQYNDDFPDLFAPVTAYQAGDEVLNVDPELERQYGMQSYTNFADYPFDLSGDWTSFDNSHPH